MKPIDFSDSTEANEYFSELLKTMHGVKIVAIFSYCPMFNNHQGYRTYEDGTEIYILFENGECLVVDYRFIDALSVSLHKFSEEEKKLHEEANPKDFFNDSTDIYNMTADNRTVLRCNQTISLEYDSLVSIELEKVTIPYAKWIDGDINDEVLPLSTTFEKIVFTMANGNTFVICPADAAVDGYTMVWSQDAQETITEL